MEEDPLRDLIHGAAPLRAPRDDADARALEAAFAQAWSTTTCLYVMILALEGLPDAAEREAVYRITLALEPLGGPFARFAGLQRARHEGRYEAYNGVAFNRARGLASVVGAWERRFLREDPDRAGRLRDACAVLRAIVPVPPTYAGVFASATAGVLWSSASPGK